jgi:hypothetical protein
MKKAFIISSAIEVDNSHPLTYSSVRSHFSNEERFRHTVMTIAALDHVSDSETTIYILDTSDNWQFYRDQLSYQKNLKFISVKEEFPDIIETVKTHRQKSYCECLMISSFMKKYQAELFENDYIFKMSGRYFIDGSFKPDLLLNKYHTDNIFFKEHIQWEWKDSWFYSLVDRRKEQRDNYLRQYSSVFFGWGKKHHKHFMDIWLAMTAMLALPNMAHYDVETLLHYLTRTFEQDIIETDWKVYGWLGPSGHFVRY